MRYVGRLRAPEAVADGPHGAVWFCVDAEGRAIGNPCMQSYGDDATGEVMKNIMAWYNPLLPGDLLFALQERDDHRQCGR